AGAADLAVDAGDVALGEGHLGQQVAAVERDRLVEGQTEVDPLVDLHHVGADLLGGAEEVGQMGVDALGGGVEGAGGGGHLLGGSVDFGRRGGDLFGGGVDVA